MMDLYKIREDLVLAMASYSDIEITEVYSIIGGRLFVFDSQKRDQFPVTFRMSKDFSVISAVSLCEGNGREVFKIVQTPHGKKETVINLIKEFILYYGEAPKLRLV